jgi:hypothetical protein
MRLKLLEVEAEGQGRIAGRDNVTGEIYGDLEALLYLVSLGKGL